MTAEELSMRMSSRELTERRLLDWLDHKYTTLVYTKKMDPEVAASAVWGSLVDLGV